MNIYIPKENKEMGKNSSFAWILFACVFVWCMAWVAREDMRCEMEKFKKVADLLMLEQYAKAKVTRA